MVWMKIHDTRLKSSMGTSRLHTSTSRVVTLNGSPRLNWDQVREVNCELLMRRIGIVINTSLKAVKVTKGPFQLHPRGLRVYSGVGDLESELARKELEGEGGVGGRMGKEDSQPLPPLLGFKYHNSSAPEFIVFKSIIVLD